MQKLKASATAFLAFLVLPAFAQVSAKPATNNAICTFEDGTEIRVSYSNPADNDKKDLPKDKMWTPGDQPMTFFTASALSLAGTAIPPGAYSMHLIPGKSEWTLIMNKDVTPGHEYDASKDLARATMDVGRLPVSQDFQIGFARMGPKQCNLRLYYGQVGTWVAFNEQ